MRKVPQDELKYQKEQSQEAADKQPIENQHLFDPLVLSAVLETDSLYATRCECRLYSTASVLFAHSGDVDV